MDSEERFIKSVFPSKALNNNAKIHTHQANQNRVETLAPSDYIINYQKKVHEPTTSHKPMSRLRSLWNCSLLSLRLHQTVSSNESSREHTTAFFSSTLLLSFVLVSPFKRAHPPETRAEFMRTNHPSLLLSPGVLPAVHRVVLSEAEICYKSSIRIQVSGSESGVTVSGVLCGVVMNVQSPVLGRMVLVMRTECEMVESRFEMGVLSTRCDSKEPVNAGVGGNDSGVSISVLICVWIVSERC
jgi:hypothetical protein